MKAITTFIVSLVLCSALSGCFFLAGTAAGAGAGVVYKDDQEHKGQ